MKTTKELYGIDPTEFKTMLYPEVLLIKDQASNQIYTDAHTEQFKIGYHPLSVKDKERVAELQVIGNEANKALSYIKLWQEELEGNL